MECKQFSIQGYFESAKYFGDLEALREVLESSNHWTADVLEKAGTKQRIVETIQRYNQRHPSRVMHSKNRSMVAIAPVGKKQCLAYRLESDPKAGTKITPVPYLEGKAKIGIAFMLSLAFFFPVLLSPWVWRRYEQNNLRMSRYYLVSLCHYLESRLGS